MDFELLGPIHLAILLGVPGAAWALSRLALRRPSTARPLRIVWAAFLILNGLAWYAYAVKQGWGGRFPDGLPLQLCDLTLWMTVGALLSAAPGIRELAYFWVLSGSTLALLTPDLGEGVSPVRAWMFFALHGGSVAGILFLVWSGLFRPRPGSVGRALIGLNVYAAVIAVFNVAFGTNYLYLCRKPANPSLFDVLGPWPWYLLSCELLAWFLFRLLYRPLKRY